MKKMAILIPALSLFLFSCGNMPNNESKEGTDTVAQVEEHQHHDEEETIELNNGEKWTVDSNMMVHIRNMESDVASFATAGQKDYKALSEKLQANVELLTSNCTMKGKAHDELHKWLLPYIDVVDQLSEAKDEMDAEARYQKIQTSFSVFNQYFQ